MTPTSWDSQPSYVYFNIYLSLIVYILVLKSPNGEWPIKCTFFLYIIFFWAHNGFNLQPAGNIFHLPIYFFFSVISCKWLNKSHEGRDTLARIKPWIMSKKIVVHSMECLASIGLFSIIIPWNYSVHFSDVSWVWGYFICVHVVIEEKNKLCQIRNAVGKHAGSQGHTSENLSRILEHLNQDPQRSGQEHYL